MAGIFSVVVAFLALAGIVVSAPSPSPRASIRTVWQSVSETWLENLAVRPNGSILATSMFPNAHLWQFNPFDGSEQILLTFPAANTTMGITEIDDDVYAVITGNFSCDSFIPQTGSYSLWTVNFNPHIQPVPERIGKRIVEPIEPVEPIPIAPGSGGAVTKVPRISKVVDIPTGGFLNGITVLNKAENTVLISDSFYGTLYRVNTHTGDYAIVQKHASMALANNLFGINGIHIRNNKTLYFANSGQETLTTVTINPDGTAAGRYHSINIGEKGDDFTFDAQGNALVATNLDDSLVMVSLADGSDKVTSLLGSPKSTILEGATSAAWGRTAKDKNVLYMTTNGGMPKPVGKHFLDGKLAAVDVVSLIKNDKSQ